MMRNPQHNNLTSRPWQWRNLFDLQMHWSPIYETKFSANSFPGRGIRPGDGRAHPRGKTRRLLHVLSRPHFAPFCSEVAGHGGKSLGTFWTAMIGP
ncbi:hypothetical protein CDAR_414801 [Caerostris darwini]|uniref:Uncharacterized protein n=1 Tax=Caerostris darwini TaxID=1538125 RepID=A0AAV4RG43_9ARAC|nr:hypothetical protein CDAR_414801 [Caerostris darwini]